MELNGAQVFSIAALCICFSTAAGWSYENVDEWPAACANTAKSQQSPIDIKTTSLAANNTLVPFTFSSAYSQNSTTTWFDMKNNGHTVQLTVRPNEITNLFIQNGGLPDRYNFAQFHMHWGSADCNGSEHTLNGQSFPMELHLVHYNNKYDNLSQAVGNPDGLAVLGVFADVGNVAHKALDLLIQQFSTLKYANMVVNVSQQFKMSDMLPPVDKLTEFIRYSGSLTTPDCNEIVNWTVFKEPIKISHTQLYALRAISHSMQNETEDHPLEDNFRPPQPLNGRTVYKTANYASGVNPKTPSCQQHTEVTTTPPGKTCKASTFELSLFGYALVTLIVGRKVLGL